MSTLHDPTGSFSLLDAVIATYLQGVESGQSPDRSDIIAGHPDLADPLRAFFADFDRIDRVAAPFRLDAAPTPPAAVRYFGDYELIEEVARGGMGIVYRARQVSLNRVVALKMVLAGGHASPKAIQRFRLEAEAAANLDHPHIVPIHEVGDHEGIPYYSMKFVDGVPLGQHPRGTFRDEAAALATVARAVHHAHHHGVLHRDLKPANVLVDPKLGWLVTDFGLAKRLSDVDAELTETGDILGTPRYMAPEQAAGRRDLTVTADVYSLGAILFERLTGRPPFLADNVVTLLHQVRESDPPRPSTLVPGLGRDLETIVLKCLDKDPGRRYASAEAMAVDLENYVAGRPIAARPVGKVGKTWRWCKRNPAVAGLMATVAASMVAGTVVSVAFAVKADARALDAGMAGTRANILLARNLVEYDPNRDDLDDISKRTTDVGLLTYARAFALAPAHGSANDLRWCILANLAVEAQKRLPLSLAHNNATPETAVSLSPDGWRLAMAGLDGIVRVREVPSGRLITTFSELPKGNVEMVFSADGRQLAVRQEYRYRLAGADIPFNVNNGIWNCPILNTDSSNFDPAVRIVDLATSKIKVVLPHKFSPDGVEFNGDGDRIFTWTLSPGATTDFFLWDIAGVKSTDPTKSREPLLMLNHQEMDFAGKGLVDSPDGGMFAIRSTKSFKYNRVYDTRTGSFLCMIPGEGLAWSPDGREVVTADMIANPEPKAGSNPYSKKYRVRFWKIPSGTALSSITNIEIEHDTHSDDALVLKYSPDGRFVFGGEAQNSSFETVSRATSQSLSRQAGDLPSFSPDGSIAFLSDGQAFDANSWIRLRPAAGRLFHTSLYSRAKLGCLFSVAPATWDIQTEIMLGFESYEFSKAKELPNGLVWLDGPPRGLGNGRSMRWLPREPFASDPRTVELWAEVLVRKRLVGNHEAEPLTENEWEDRRHELIRLLPASPSPLLANLANDQAHWRREEAKLVLDKPEQLVPALDRLIEIEPTWYYRHSRGLAQAKLRHWDAAIHDFLAAGREAGAWYWDNPPAILTGDLWPGDRPSNSTLAILDDDTMSDLLIDHNPERTLRETLHHGREFVEVLIHYLAYMRRDDDRLSRAVAYKMTRPNPSPASVAMALEFTGRLIDLRRGKNDDLSTHGMALYRAGRYVEAYEYLDPRNNKRWNSREIFKGTLQTKTKLMLAMTQARLGRLREAKQILGTVSSPGSNEVDLLEEAKALILDHGFPADPFAPLTPSREN